MTYRQHVAQQNRRRAEHQARLELLDPTAGLSPLRSEAHLLTPRPCGLPETRTEVPSDKYERTGSAFGPAKRIKES